MEIDWIAEGFGSKFEPMRFKFALLEGLEDTDDIRKALGYPSKKEEATLHAKIYFDTLLSSPSPKFVGNTVLMDARQARLTALVLQSYMNGNDPFDVSVKNPSHCPNKEDNIGLILKMYLAEGTPTEISQVALAKIIIEAKAKELGKEIKGTTFSTKTIRNKIEKFASLDDLDVKKRQRLQMVARNMLDMIIEQGMLISMLKGK